MGDTVRCAEFVPQSVRKAQRAVENRPGEVLERFVQTGPYGYIPVFFELHGPETHPRRELQLLSHGNVLGVRLALGQVLEKVTKGLIAKCFDGRGHQGTVQILNRMVQSTEARREPEGVIES